MTEKKTQNPRRTRRRRAVQQSQSIEYNQASASISDDEVSLTTREESEIEDIAETPQEANEMRKAALLAKKNKEALKRAKAAVNKAVPAETLVQRPRYGHITGVATYHTTDAYRFLLGRSPRTVIKNGKRERQTRIIGLFEAAEAVKQIEAGYQAGCAYAAWTLVRIEEQIKEVRSLFARSKQEAENLIQLSTMIRLHPFESKTPSEVQLNFKSPYAYHFADILSQYDLLLRSVVNYKMEHFISQDDYRTIEKQLGTPLRRLFKLTDSWSFVGQEAVDSENHVFMDAEQRMGILPEKIKSGEVIPQFVKPPVKDDVDGEKNDDGGDKEFPENSETVVKDNENSQGSEEDNV